MVGYYKVKAKKGLLVREGAALDTPEVTTLDNGLRITCEEEATVDGKVRLRLTSPVRGWASKKLMDFECKLGARPTGATPWLRKLAAPEKAEKRIVYGTPTKRYSYDVKPEAIEADIAAALN